MGTKILDIDQNQLENRESTNNEQFPFQLDYEEIRNYVGAAFGCHWHPEVEFTYIIEGSMTYVANNHQYHAKAGDAIFVNQNCLHSGRAIEDQGCSYFSITFNPLLITGHPNGIFQNKYINEIVNNDWISSMYFDGDEVKNRAFINILLEIEKVVEHKIEGYELLIESKLFELWYHLYRQSENERKNHTSPKSKNIFQIKAALDYIHSHFQEELSLEEIASQCNLSKSACCRLFKNILSDSPIDYLLKYRIQKSIPYLAMEAMSITEIALAVGFSSSSYYAEVFKKYRGCSPREYRRNVKRLDD